MFNSLLNMFIITPFFSFFNYLTGRPLANDFSVEGVPSIYTFFFQVLFCAIVEDFLFHMGHRLNHTPFLYQRVHKIHHKYKTTLFCAAFYSHPIEMIFQGILPAAVGPFLLGKKMHVTTVVGWLLIRALESVDGHSGYEFPWSPFRFIPFTSDYGYHVYHHSHNLGNYSHLFNIWDTILGSNE